MQHVRIAPLKVVIEHAVILSQQSLLAISLGEVEGGPKVVQRFGPGVAAVLLQLVRQVHTLQLRIQRRVKWKDRVVR